jgi:hypothetical protein
MRFPRKVRLLAVATLAAVLTSCTPARRVIETRVETKPAAVRTEVKKHKLTAAQRRALVRWFRYLALKQYLAALIAADRARMSSQPWPCIAIAESGGTPIMGPTYWTEYGVVVDIIEDYGTPSERQAIFGGYADALIRWRPVERFAKANGYGGWGVLTKQKCGL